MIRIAATGAMAFAVAATGACGAAERVSVPVCFTARQNQHLPFAVIQQAPPPRAGEADYRYYPQTAVATMQMDTLSRAPAGTDAYFFHWANRSNANVVRKPNLQPSSSGLRRQRTAFTSVARADACTMAQLASLLGTPDEAKPEAAKSGMTLVLQSSQPDDAARNRSAVGPSDACVLPDAALPSSVRGVLLDFEVADGRSPDEALALLTRYAARVHRAGLRAILLIDPFDAPSQRLTGIGQSNAGAIVRAFDTTTLMLWSKNAAHDLAASYRAQRAIVGDVDPQRLVIDFDLAGTSEADAAFVHTAIERDRLGGVLFWRNRASQGGNCSDPVNRKIALIVFGEPSARGPSAHNFTGDN